MVQFNRWTLLKLVEVVLVVACLTFKRVTDDEASRVFLYLQKVSREWSLLNNITWSKVGAAVADTTYGGYLIICAALFLGHLFGELPTTSRISEYILLGMGTILFIVMGSLSFAALDSVPANLVDNAAIVGTLSLVVAALFLLDMGGPKKRAPKSQSTQPKKVIIPPDSKVITKQVYEVDKDKQKMHKVQAEVKKPEEIQYHPKKEKGIKVEKNGRNGVTVMEMQTANNHSNGYQRMRDDSKRFGIYGQDVTDEASTEAEDVELPPQMETHSPVWSNIRKGEYGKYDILNPKYILRRSDRLHEEIRPPSSPGDPGYVQYTAQHWGETDTKTPRHSPTYFSRRDQVVLKLKMQMAGNWTEIIIAPVYLPFDSPSPPPSYELEQLVNYCRAANLQILIGMAANSHHTAKNSSDIKSRDPFIQTPVKTTKRYENSLTF